MSDLTPEIDPALWVGAIALGKRLLRDCVKRGEIVTYAEFVENMPSIILKNAADPSVDQLLDEISTDEHFLGRGLLSAIVVDPETNMPRPAFFALARQLGYSFNDETAFRLAELIRIHKFR